MTTVLIDYGAGNLHSVEKAFRHVAPDAGIIVTADPRIVGGADRIVLPGVGAFADCMDGLLAVDGLFDALHESVMERQRPFFGICVGMQMMLEEGREHGNHKGLGWLRGRVEAIRPADKSLKIPHMGWNDLRLDGEHPLFEGVQSGDHAYFVHSYHAVCDDASDVLATVDYGAPITAAIGRDNLFGTQFHPEKSQKTGLTIIRNFLKI
ncbi:MAG: imidazole glycerol phosphate synthase subunit HisH [Alphaproteobacteria bacterium]|nr:imidazole glycerol phosphate synthase subunit HisH [Alphaproteobacteria bacterium]